MKENCSERCDWPMCDCKDCVLLNKVQKVQASVATDDDSSNADGSIKKALLQLKGLYQEKPADTISLTRQQLTELLRKQRENCLKVGEFNQFNSNFRQAILNAPAPELYHKL